jgi:hypothetical protein
MGSEADAEEQDLQSARTAACEALARITRRRHRNASLSISPPDPTALLPSEASRRQEVALHEAAERAVLAACVGALAKVSVQRARRAQEIAAEANLSAAESRAFCEALRAHAVLWGLRLSGEERAGRLRIVGEEATALGAVQCDESVLRCLVGELQYLRDSEGIRRRALKAEQEDAFAYLARTIQAQLDQAAARMAETHDAWP